jgi:HPt (histidine-containing phosphotransfer) domain-containing protein
MQDNPHFDDAVLNTLKDIMGADFHHLVDTFISDTDERIRHLHAAVAAGESDSIRRTAHSLKGSSSNIGAAQLATFCSVIEAKALANELDVLPEQLAALELEFKQVSRLLHDMSS